MIFGLHKFLIQKRKPETKKTKQITDEHRRRNNQSEGLPPTSPESPPSASRTWLKSLTVGNRITKNIQHGSPPFSPYSESLWPASHTAMPDTVHRKMIGLLLFSTPANPLSKCVAPLAQGRVDGEIKVRKNLAVFYFSPG